MDNANKIQQYAIQVRPLGAEDGGGFEFLYPQLARSVVGYGARPLVSNAIKHGQSEITITLTATDRTARLEVCDDGPGFPAGFDWRRAANTGLGLIDSTGSHDLRGKVQYENRPEGGAKVLVVFSLNPFGKNKCEL